MPWLKASDKLATHPLILGVRRVIGADERTVNEVTGFLTRCATSSASYETDYCITLDVAELYGGSRTELLLRQAVKAGLARTEGRGRSRLWVLVEEEDLWHIRAKEDVAWEKQRDRDRRNVDVIMPVLARDGDQCRYCRNVVIQKDTRSGRGRTFDHLEPGKAARVETYVVCCITCNSKLKRRQRPVAELPLLAPPALPYFSPRTSTRVDVEEYFGHPIQSATNPAEHPESTAKGQSPGSRPRKREHPESTAKSQSPGSRPLDEVGADQDHGRPPWSGSGLRVEAGSGRELGQEGAGAPPPSWAVPSDPDPPKRTRRSHKPRTKPDPSTEGGED